MTTLENIDFETLTDQEAQKILRGMGESAAFIFNMLDQDGDGRLTPAEIDAAPDILRTLDKDGDGELNETELEGYGFHFMPGRIRFNALVRMLDSDGDLHVTAEDIVDAPNRIRKLDRDTDILELTLPKNADGTYDWDGEVVTIWSFKAATPQDIFAPFMSGVDRTPSGNTVFALGHNKRVIEVTPDGDVVADFRVPGAGNTFRVRRYGFDYPGLAKLKTT